VSTTSDSGGFVAQPVVIRQFAVTRVMTGDPWRENCFIVEETQTREAAIFDPGAAPEVIAGCIEESNATVSHVLLTHAHHDHVGAVQETTTRFGVPCRLHAADVKLLRQAPLYALRFARRKIAAATSIEAFDDHQREFQLGHSSFQVMPTPGHTAGGVCFVFPGFVITGDTLLFEHIGRTDLPGSSRETLMASVDALLGRLDDADTLFPGHGRSWTVGGARSWWATARSAPPALEQHATF
jgi:hydroxyacylglutathione hydrolase